MHTLYFFRKTKSIFIYHSETYKYTYNITKIKTKIIIIISPNRRKRKMAPDGLALLTG